MKNMLKLLGVIHWVMTLSILWMPLLSLLNNPENWQHGWIRGFAMSFVGAVCLTRHYSYIDYIKKKDGYV